MNKKLSILMVASEATPFAKTGGLADVVGALPYALAELGCQVRVVIPCYGAVKKSRRRLVRVREKHSVAFSGRRIETSLFRALKKDAVEWYFIDAPFYFQRDKLYGYDDEFERTAFFCQEVVRTIAEMDWRPDIVHCHDWQTALIPAYIANPTDLGSVHTGKGFFSKIATLFTIHNMAFQGVFDSHLYGLTGLSPSLYNMHGLEFYGQMNLMKAGLIFADRLSTVSEQYSWEIQTPEQGYRLDGVLRERSEYLSGLLNGIDHTVWNPEKDQFIPAPFSADRPKGKDECKKALLRADGLVPKKNVPLIGIISRLADQKGLDLVVDTIDSVLAMDVQLILLGTGHAHYHKLLRNIALKYPDRVAIHLTFDEGLAHRIEAGADMFLMPSRYEPCGLNQMYSLRYGTVPIVHATGGLKDTVTEFDPATGSGNGFSFDRYGSQELLHAITRAVKTYRSPGLWRKVRHNGMVQDFSWVSSAKKYLALYRQIAKPPTGGPWGKR